MAVDAALGVLADRVREEHLDLVVQDGLLSQLLAVELLELGDRGDPCVRVDQQTLLAREDLAHEVHRRVVVGLHEELPVEPQDLEDVALRLDELAQVLGHDARDRVLLRHLRLGEDGVLLLLGGLELVLLILV